MEAYLAEVRKMEKQLSGLELQHVPRGTNKEADGIATRASKRQPQEPDVFEERPFKPSATPPLSSMTQPREELPHPPAMGAPACGPTSGARMLLALEPQEECWIKEFKEYLMHGTLPEKEEDAEHVARQAMAYCIQDGELYRKRPNDVTLRCISSDQGRELLIDIHGGDCGHHSSSRTLVGKLFRSGFYWSTALNDATELVKSCEACQFHAKQIHQPAQGLQTIPLTWPFAVWGLDILGPFPQAPGGYRYLYVVVDKFTKWEEVEAVRTIPAGSAIKFIKGLVSCFGVPNCIMTDNGSQFTRNLFKTYCANLGTRSATLRWPTLGVTVRTSALTRRS